MLDDLKKKGKPVTPKLEEMALWLDSLDTTTLDDGQASQDLVLRSHPNRAIFVLSHRATPYVRATMLRQVCWLITKGVCSGMQQLCYSHMNSMWSSHMLMQEPAVE